MVRFSDMVVTPHEFTVHTAVRPRIVMLWVFFLVTVVVVGPSVPASAFVSCTWHHSQLVGENPQAVTDDSKPVSAIDAKVHQARITHGTWHPIAASSALSLAAVKSSPIGITPTGIAPRAPPASH
jgi:hypothetical protein